MFSTPSGEAANDRLLPVVELIPFIKINLIPEISAFSFFVCTNDDKTQEM